MLFVIMTNGSFPSIYHRKSTSFKIQDMSHNPLSIGSFKILWNDLYTNNSFYRTEIERLAYLLSPLSLIL